MSEEKRLLKRILERKSAMLTYRYDTQLLIEGENLSDDAIYDGIL